MKRIIKFYQVNELNYNSINGYATSSLIVPDYLLPNIVDRLTADFKKRYELTENDEDLYTEHYGNAVFLSAFDDKHNTTIVWYELDKPTLHYYQKLGQLMNSTDVDEFDLQCHLDTIEL